MDTLPPKPSSSRAKRNRDRDRKRHGDTGRQAARYSDRDGAHDRDRHRDRDRDRDRDRRRRHRRRTPSPLTEPAPKRHRANEASKGKTKSKGEIGDDFVPFAASDGESSRSERTRQKDKDKARDKSNDKVRAWDVGKPPRDDGARGTKRAHGGSDDERGHSRRGTEPRQVPWVAQVDWDGCHNVAEMLHREVEAFVRYMSPTPVEDEMRGLVIQLVSKAITSAFPDARILPFGSYETKLYLPSGDIDLVIDSDSMARSNKVHVLHALANTLKRAGITSKVTVISKAKVPIVKFVTQFGRLNVDISVNQGNGVKAGKIVNGFLQNMRGGGLALCCLIVIAKAFLNQRGMNEVYTGGLGSYSIVCLAISFLQMHPKIRRGEIEPEKNLGVLVMEFFELYGRYFNYEEVGISIRNGGAYFSKRQRGWYDFTRGLLLSIEDPTDTSNDISRGSYGINKVRQTFSGAFGIMQATSFMRAGILSSRREGRSHRLRLATHPEDMSILSSILGVTQETINNRRLLQEVYDARLLHKLLCVAPQASVDVPDDGGAHGQSCGAQEEWDDDVQGGRNNGAVEEASSDESGRYDIQERRRTRSGHPNGTGRIEVTEYTTDEDDLSEDERDDLAYDSAGSGDGIRERRRSYWLSKGIGPQRREEEEEDIELYT